MKAAKTLTALSLLHDANDSSAYRLLQEAKMT